LLQHNFKVSCCHDAAIATRSSWMPSNRAAEMLQCGLPNSARLYVSADVCGKPQSMLLLLLLLQCTRLSGTN
jgi:hypothetical protein